MRAISRKSRNRALTLVELLLVMMLIALVAGAFGFGIQRALVTQRFRSDVERLTGVLQLAQNMMLLAGRDVDVVLEATDAGFEYRLEIQPQLPSEWGPVLARSQGILKGIHGITFEDTLPVPSPPNQHIFRFYSNGMMMSQGVVRLAPSSVETGGERQIVLRGYPHPLTSQVAKEGDPLEFEEKEAESLNVEIETAIRRST